MVSAWKSLFRKIDPAAFTIPLPDMDLGPLHLGPFPIRWYALAYIFGADRGLVGMRARSHRNPRSGVRLEKSPVTRADIDDFAFYAMIGILLGGRIGYILFYTIPYEPEKLFGPNGDLLFILRMWEGGMSFHGGLIGANDRGALHRLQPQALRAAPRRRRLRRGADRSPVRPPRQLHQWRALRSRDHCAVGHAFPDL